MNDQSHYYDVVVVGGGNAGLCAALSARESGASVLVVERAPRHARGGNSWFTGGLFRIAYAGIDDIRRLIPDLSEDEIAAVDVGAYTADEFFTDIARVTEYQADPELISILTTNSFETMLWLREKGVRFGLALKRQAFKSGERFRFWGGGCVESVGGGIGLVDMLFRAAGEEGIEVWYEARAKELAMDERGAVRGIIVQRQGHRTLVEAGAVVLASGGFQANSEMRAKYLGPNWDVTKVRGTEHNTGDGIAMALAIGAQPYGHWSGCHAVAWDVNAPPTGDRKVGDSYQKHSYPLGIIVNRQGERFVDEGADFRNYTYAKCGHEILKQPGMVAFQIFDSKVLSLLRDEYRIPQVTRAEAQTVDELADALEIDRQGLAHTIVEFNAAVTDAPFDPTIMDGKGTIGLTPPKSNWALRLDAPPYVGYAVTCGITFTFGGLRIEGSARVLSDDGVPIQNLYAAGELVGGLFYHNYPGGSGLTAGSVFGRIAGQTAASVVSRAERV